ncbi:HEPN domain-containing protein [Caldivirga sp.]|uniref:HEPN domain-containing protein n=1 Tax=Caldivirga sp. TaxID=2080243 RepID=UPI0025C6A627|nr:HEPN domain-containing protein [Caldivirga sp.]
MTELVKKAEDWFEVAKGALREGRFWLVCYASHQAVELYAKGVLFMRAGSYPFTHNLVTLIKLIDLNASTEVLNSCRVLNPHYSASRYDSSSIYDKDTAVQCLTHAEVVITWLRTLLEK